MALDFAGLLLIAAINIVSTLIVLRYSAKYAYKVDATFGQALVQLIAIIAIQVIISVLLYLLLS